MVGLTSAAGLVGLLAEPDAQLRTYALRRLNDEVDLLWPEVADSVGDIEALYEDEGFAERELAALVVSRIYYHLQEYHESMIFALRAGKLFDLSNPGEFEETIIAKCVDSYIWVSASHTPLGSVAADQHLPPELVTTFPQSAEGGGSTSAGLTSPTTPFTHSTLPSKSLLSRETSSTTFLSTFDPVHANGAKLVPPGTSNPFRGLEQRLESVISTLFEQCFQQGRYRQVMGIVIEARNLDALKHTIIRAHRDHEQRHVHEKQDGPPGAHAFELLEYLLQLCMTVVQERALRNEILKLILEIHTLPGISQPDYFAIARCVVYLDEHELAADILERLVNDGDASSLAKAYQIAFDLFDNSTQEFLAKVRKVLPEAKEAAPASLGASHPTDGETDAQETDALLANHHESSDHAAPPPTMNGGVKDDEPPLSDDQKTAYTAIRNILTGTKSIELNLEFLYRNNHTDLNILNRIKDSLEARNSIFHNAVTFANAFMNAGTTSDIFFRKNLEWLGKAVNWSKFTATAALGVIHRGNLSQGKRLLEPYLPRDNLVTGSAYSQGGSLYALGLIYANHGTRVLDYLRDQFQKAEDEVVQHGGALGLGVAGMATGSDDIYEDLKTRLFTDSAVNGEAVGLAMGLVMLGTGSVKALEVMLRYAHETQHEKIVRGLALGMALIMFGRQEAADELISVLLEDADPTLRYGGIMTLAMAYCGTGSNKAVRRLLHVAVSDVSDDVRRVAVMSLGFILFRKPSTVPGMVELLSESYNPHVRYGAAMALGISCAGTGLAEAIDLLEPMVKDPTDFVRQGAVIAVAMILIEQNEAMNPKVTSVRKTLQRIIGDRHEDAMAKFGCALAMGIIDAGGRNCTIGLQTQTGNLNMAGVVGMAVFTQYWYWFPFTHFLSLSFTPTSIIGLDQDLEIPQLRFHCATRPSLFDYPPEQETKTDEAPEKVATAVLSTTMQAKRRAQRKEKQLRRESMDLDQVPTTPKTTTVPPEEKMDIDEEHAVETEKKPKGADGSDGKVGEKDASTAETSKKKADKERERVGYDVMNMSRVLPTQLQHLTLPEARYEPVKAPTGGVILLVDKHPSEPKELLELKAKGNVDRAAAAAAGGAAGDANTNAGGGGSTTEAESSTGGAAEAAGVLTAVDEDDEGGEDAEMPREFDYYSEGEDEA
ncbi:MAG: Protoheme IX farnesyltransferase, mitochondrial [Watsoniomyces obsoletus]|nr:MAG: Protoheme IX farnesyltransferase, mitochondrial [Watsoniomyces obsoletus]